MLSGILKEILAVGDGDEETALPLPLPLRESDIFKLCNENRNSNFLHDFHWLNHSEIVPHACFSHYANI